MLTYPRVLSLTKSCLNPFWEAIEMRWVECSFAGTPVSVNATSASIVGQNVFTYSFSAYVRRLTTLFPLLDLSLIENEMLLIEPKDSAERYWS